MEALAQSVQQAQAAVLSVQGDVALLQAQLEADGAASALHDGDGGAVAANPYYVELQAAIQHKQEAAAELLQRSAHAFYEQFRVLEERAERLGNVHEREKELQAAKRSMQRYFDAHAKELAETKDSHEGAMRLELLRRENLESGAAEVRQAAAQQRVAHHVLMTWMKKAMLRSVTRDYVARQRATRHTYQDAACEALTQQRCVVNLHRVFHSWRSRLQRRQMQKLEDAVVESERRAQFFRNELAVTQEALKERLRDSLAAHSPPAGAATAADAAAAAAAERAAVTPSGDGAVRREEAAEVRRLRTALAEMTLEFSERTGTYIRQQEHLEQLFLAKEAKLQGALLDVQGSLTQERQRHQTYAAQQQTFVQHVCAHWEGLHREWVAAMQRKEDYAHHTALGLVGRLRHRHRTLQAEAAKLADEVHTLAPLSERCVRVEGDLAHCQRLLQSAKERNRPLETQAKAAGVVAALLTDRLEQADHAALRARYFLRWLQHSHAATSTAQATEVAGMRERLQQQRQQLLVQQQESAARHRAEVAQLQEQADQLRRANVRLRAEVEAASAQLTARDAALLESEMKNADVTAAALREKMERRGAQQQWWAARAEVVVLAEKMERCRVESQQLQWWAALQSREAGALKVWSAALQHDAAQLAAVCEGWAAHCQQAEAEQSSRTRLSAGRQAAALERAHLQAQTLLRWTLWRTWARQRRELREAAEQASQARTRLVDRHSAELARLHASHDAVVRRQQEELALEKTHLQAIHQERQETQRRRHAEEQSNLALQHRQHVAELMASHAAMAEEQESVVRQLQAQQSDLGSVVVEYCAAATFAQWRSWAMRRQAQRSTAQRRGFLVRAQDWHSATTQLEEDALLAKQRLLTQCSAAVLQAQQAALRATRTQAAQERETHDGLQRKAERARAAAEAEAAHLRTELQHTRSLLEAEKQYAEDVQATAHEERRTQRTAMTLAARLEEWREGTHRVMAAQSVAKQRVMEAAVADLLTDACVDIASLREAYVDAVKEHEATRKVLHAANAQRAQLAEEHERLADSHATLQRKHAELSKEASELTDTLARLVAEHEDVRAQLQRSSDDAREVRAAHAELQSEHTRLQGELEAAQAETDSVARAYADYRQAHEQQRAGATPQLPPAAESVTRGPASAGSSWGDDSVEVSDLEAQEEPHPESEPPSNVSPSLATTADSTASRVAGGSGGAGTSDSATLSNLSAQPLVLFDALVARLRELEVYAHGRTEVQRTDSEGIAPLLSLPFTTVVSPESAASPISAAAVLPYLLETVRLAAVRLCEDHERRHTDEVDALRVKCALAEEALQQLRESMEGLLAEQRSLAEEMSEEEAVTARQQECDTPEPSQSPGRSPSVQVRLWEERLAALTERYARVLDAFYGDITRRQDTFYSVNGMLVEVDEFSAGLLQRFEDNAQEMARLQRQIGAAAPSQQQQLQQGQPGTPVAQPSADDLSMMSPEPAHPQSIEPPFLARVLSETATPPHLEGSAPGPQQTIVSPSSSSSSASSGNATPEKRALRERVHLLERLLVEAKVQVAEASTLIDSAGRSRSVAAASPQAQAWAAQDAKDFGHLGLTVAQFVALYAAEEAAARAIVTELRAGEGRLRDAQEEMSQQLRTACLSVEESVQQRHRAEAERYESTLRSCNASMTEATRQHAREMQQYEQMVEQLRAEMAEAAERHARDVQAMRHSYATEVAELTEHLQLLEEELERTRRSAAAAVAEAVGRQTELLTLEHTQAMRSAEKRLTRLRAERALLEERLEATEAACERRLRQERDAVARMQQRLSDMAEGDRSEGRTRVCGTGLEVRWEAYASATAGLYAAYAADKAKWYTACVTAMVEEERGEWETELMQLRERVASLLDRDPTATLPSRDGDVSKGMRRGPSASLHRSPPSGCAEAVEDSSSPALTLSPSPQRSTAKSAGNAAPAASPPRTPAAHRSVSWRTRDAQQPPSAGTTPTRCRSPSLDSLELSQSLLRYSKRLSDHRSRNTERLERATALTAEVDDLLLRGAELSRLADKHDPR